MKLVSTLFAAAACLCALPAVAQGPSSHYDAGMADRPDTQALAFIRIPIGEKQEKSQPRIGFGLFTDCSRLAAQLSAEQRSVCDGQQVRSFEVTRRLSERTWLFSFASENRWVGIARLYPDGFGTVREFGPVLSEPRLDGPVN